MGGNGRTGSSARVLGVILAAGAGRRYGAPKITAHQGDWLRKAVHVLDAGGCDEVVVAMGAQIVAPPPPATAWVIADWTSGLGATVCDVLGRVSERADLVGVVLHVVDTPDVGPEVVARVLEASGRSPTALVRACFHGRPGHPVYLGTAHLGPVMGTLSGDIGAGRYLAAHDDEVTVVECGDLATGLDHDFRVGGEPPPGP
ncbi:nucleotidyltransferase family protein [Gordonia rhizosphera]|nr:NTP transferase domain-containing protein [Gordonia rhizosphera]